MTLMKYKKHSIKAAASGFKISATAKEICSGVMAKV